METARPRAAERGRPGSNSEIPQDRTLATRAANKRRAAPWLQHVRVIRIVPAVAAYSAVEAAKAGLAKEGYPWLITKRKRRENLLLRAPISPGANCLRGAFQFLLRKFLLQRILKRLL